MEKISEELKSFGNVYRQGVESKIKFWFFGIIGLILVFMFLPWTQNIKSKGSVTSLQQDQRPQELNSPIPGRISKWYVKEGDQVLKGDTILLLTEIKNDYLDPNLINRTKEQLVAKKESVKFYRDKIISYDAQLEALNNGRVLKIKQLENKLVQLNNKLDAEKAGLKAANNEYELSKNQFERQEKMFKDGLVSQTKLQERNVKFQNSLSKKIESENKVAQIEQEILNNKIEQNSASQEYNEKISKVESERFQSLSQISVSEGEVSKLENTLSNYILRNDMYVLTAPQDGQIVQAKSAGLGEIIKEGERIVTIVPSNAIYAVEMFVRPIDLPLVKIGQKVRFVFDGFPSIVFSGWPQSSYGTFGGVIVAVENSISKKGMFRVLVKEDIKDRKWPNQLRIGSGAQGITLLHDVPIWYELWRNVNGFPPDYYVDEPQVEVDQLKK
jgi:multidrug resistance efflux pump